MKLLRNCHLKYQIISLKVSCTLYKHFIKVAKKVGHLCQCCRVKVIVTAHCQLFTLQYCLWLQLFYTAHGRESLVSK